MNSDVSTGLLVFVLASTAALIPVHIVFCRYAGTQQRLRSPQVLLVRLVMTLNIPVLGGAGLIARFELRDVTSALYMLVFAFLVFNGFAYAYFHLFNMSETARRIRMLLQIRRAGPVGLPTAELERQYSQKDMIEARLDRLVRMNQLVLGPDSRYRVGRSTLLLRAGRIMGLWRRLVFRRD